MNKNFKLTKTSLNILSTCHEELQLLFKEVIKDFDFTVLAGHRGQKEQDLFFKKGTTKLKWPNSKHNKMPSMAVDVVPYPINWKDLESFKKMAKITFEKFEELKKQGLVKHKLRWGGDFNMNGINDDNFIDMPHFELIK